MSLYLKYRSKDFDDIVEQDFIKQILKNQVIKSQAGELKLSNYLFTWARGIGKTSIARIVARWLNCLNLQDGNPCNQCENCRTIIENKSMDFYEIDAASNTSVDNVRDEIINKAIFRPTQLKKKIYIIDEVHMLSGSAFNALLKIMEEPPEYLVFILATTELHKVPETVISRCQVFNFKKITIQGIVNRLSYIAKQENIDTDEDGLKLIAQISDWGMRDAIKYLEQVSNFGAVDKTNVSNFLGLISDKEFDDFVELWKNKDSEGIVSFINKSEINGIDMVVFLKQFLSYLDDNMHGSNIPTYLQITNICKSIFEKIRFFPNLYLLCKIEFANLNPTYINTDNSSKEIDIKKWSDSIEIIKEDQPKGEMYNKDMIIGLTEEKKAKKEPTKDILSKEDLHSKEELLSIDPKELKSQILENINSKTIKDIRERSCSISKFENNTLYVDVIDRWVLVLLENPKSEKEISDTLQKIYNQSCNVRYNFIDKNELFIKMMG